MSYIWSIFTLLASTPSVESVLPIVTCPDINATRLLPFGISKEKALEQCPGGKGGLSTKTALAGITLVHETNLAEQRIADCSKVVRYADVDDPANLRSICFDTPISAVDAYGLPTHKIRAYKIARAGEISGYTIDGAILRATDDVVVEADLPTALEFPQLKTARALMRGDAAVVTTGRYVFIAVDAEYLIYPDTLPPTRSRLLLDNLSGASPSVELEWSPHEGGALYRRFHLAPGIWFISFLADPSHEPEIRPWSMGPVFAGFPDHGGFMTVDTGENDGLAHFFVKRQAAKNVAVSDLKFLGTGVGSSPYRGAHRSLASTELPGVDVVVAEMLTVLSQVAMDRARTQGVRILEARARDTVCRGWTFPGDSAAQSFSRTCAFLRATRLQDVANDPQELVTAVNLDLFSILRRRTLSSHDKIASCRHAVIGDAWRKAEVIVERRGSGLASTGPTMLQAVLRSMTQCAGLKIDQERQSTQATEAVVASLKVIDDCISHSPICSSGDIRRMLATQISVGSLWPAEVAELAVAVFNPDSELTPVARVRAALQIAFAFNDGLHGSTDERMRPLSALGDALFSQSPLSIAGALALIIDEDGGRHLAVLARRLSAAMGFFRVVDQVRGMTPEQVQASRPARVDALAAMMDATTDRSDRAGDLIVSLGAMPALGFGADLELKSLRAGVHERKAKELLGDVRLSLLQPSLPLGVSVAWSGPITWLDPNYAVTPIGQMLDSVGVLASVYMLDIGQYANFRWDSGINPPRFDSALAIGGQAGLTLFGHQTPVFFGIDVRVAPTLYSSANSVPFAGTGDLWRRVVYAPPDGGVVRASLVAGAYVPFFDIN